MVEKSDSMLELKDIKKYYTVGSSTTKVLDGVSVARKTRICSHLGTVAPGKTNYKT